MSWGSGVKLAAVVAALAVPAIAATPGVAIAQGIVSTLAGDWRGSGRIFYTDGSSEGVRCTAYYTGSGNELRMAIQCQSDTNPIHMRSRLRIDGGRASGEWEERTFNAGGTASGSVSGSALNLSITGGGLSGTMAVSFSRSAHTVSVSTEGIPMRRVSVNFSRR